MPSSYPGAVDSFPTAADLADDTLATKPHSTLHDDLGNAIVATQTEVDTHKADGTEHGETATATPTGELTTTTIRGQLDELDVRLTDQFTTLSRDRIQIVEHFFGAGIADSTIGTHGWKNINSGGAGSPGVTHNSGVDHARQVQTGTAGTGAYGSMNLGTGALNGMPTGLIEWDFNLALLSTASEEFQVYVGSHNGGAASPTRGLYFEYDRLNHGVNWQAVTNDGGTLTRVDTGVVVGSLFTGFARLAIICDPTTAVFYINGTQVASISTNLPTGRHGFNIHIIKVAGAGNRTAQGDRFVCDLSA